MAKRENSVTYRILNGGRVQVRFRLKNGDQITDGTYDTEEEAHARGQEIQVELRRGEEWDSRKGRAKFRDYMNVYMPYREKRVEAGTYRNNLTDVKVLNEYFGDMAIDEIDIEDVDLW